VAPALFLINCTSLHRFYLQFLFFNTILHRRSTSRTCTYVAVRYYSIYESAPYWKKKKKKLRPPD